MKGINIKITKTKEGSLIQDYSRLLDEELFSVYLLLYNIYKEKLYKKFKYKIGR